jgi:hypothetical protein
MVGHVAFVDMRRTECRDLGNLKERDNLEGLETKRRIILNHS